MNARMETGKTSVISVVKKGIRSGIAEEDHQAQLLFDSEKTEDHSMTEEEDRLPQIMIEEDTGKGINF